MGQNDAEQPKRHKWLGKHRTAMRVPCSQENFMARTSKNIQGRTGHPRGHRVIMKAKSSQ